MATLITLHVTGRDGKAHDVTVAGGTLMQAILDAGFESIFGICGGTCSCASCHVVVDENSFALVGSAGSNEAELLDSSDFRTPTSRLSCQIELTSALDGLIVTIAPEG